MKLARGFTIIEVLIVTAIVAILAAVVYPVYFKAAAAAKDSTTISNLRQLGEAFLLYSSENDDRMPGVTDGMRGARRHGGWIYYDAFGVGGQSHFDVSKGTLYRYVVNKQVYTSPNDPAAKLSGLSFAYNGCLIVPPFKHGGFNAGGSLGALVNPAATMLLGEEGTFDILAPSIHDQNDTDDGFFNPTNDSFAEWHTAGTAILFGDLHAKIQRILDKTEITSGSSKPCW